MDYTPQEVQLLTKTLPGIAAQLRGTLANMHAALSSGDTPDTCILRQSYYRLLRTVTNLTDASLLAEDFPLPKQDMDLVLFIDDLCRQAQPLLEQCGLTLCADLRPRHLIMGFNGTYTARIFWNLLSNAAKFTPAGGQVRVTLLQQGSQALLQVSDTGCGIAPELQDTVYDRIFHGGRMDPPPHGLGLGLGLCRCFARRQGGSLLLRSTPGQGTCVTVSLPARRCGAAVQDVPFHYAGGFQPVMMELSDALPYAGFAEKNLNILSMRILGKNRNTLKMQVRSQHGTVMDALYFGDIEQILTYIMQKYGESETEKCFQGRENAVTLSFIYYPSVNEYRGRKSLQMIISHYC